MVIELGSTIVASMAVACRRFPVTTALLSRPMPSTLPLVVDCQCEKTPLRVIALCMLDGSEDDNGQNDVVGVKRGMEEQKRPHFFFQVASRVRFEHDQLEVD